MKKLLILMIVMVNMLVCSGSVLAQDIRVGIVNAQRSVLFQVKAGELTVEGAGEPLKTLPAGAQMLISSQGGSLFANGEKLAATSLVLQPKDDTAEIEVNKRVYRGSFKVNLLSASGFLTVVNILPLEEYLYGTSALEVQPLWPEEAVKAQVIVNRSNAYRAIEQNAAKVYDIPAMSGHQAYYGKQAEQEDVSKIIDMTKGVVVTWQGDSIDAPYFDSSGGRTEDGDKPYLNSVLDYDTDSPSFEWKKIFKAEELDASIRYAGYEHIGALRGFEFSPMDLAKLDTSVDRGKSGRLRQVKIIGERGFAVVEGEKFARILNLPSSAFDLAVDNIIPQVVELPITDKFGNVIGVKKMPIEVNSNVEFPSDRTYVQRLTWAENEKIIIKGRGKGEGEGFSQWGARGQALAGKKYDEILNYYFTGTSVKKVY